MVIGVVGGAISTHPMAKATPRMLGARPVAELGAAAASAGLAYNFGVTGFSNNWNR
jgi:hydroxymethylglutaryl-CoA reductase